MKVRGISEFGFGISELVDAAERGPTGFWWKAEIS